MDKEQAISELRKLAVESNDSMETVVLELKLPVPIKTLVSISGELGKIHGKDTLFMRQVGPNLQFFKTVKTEVPSSDTPPP